MRHECPKDGCTRSVPGDMLACRPHWFMVPAPLRREVWKAWRNGAGAGTAEHNAAIAAAVDAMNGRG